MRKTTNVGIGWQTIYIKEFKGLIEGRVTHPILRQLGYITDFKSRMKCTKSILSQISLSGAFPITRLETFDVTSI